MASRFSLKDLAGDRGYQELIRKSNSLHDHHPTTKMCRESRWPYTDRLTTDQIISMRDCYMGRRLNKTRLETRHIYDRIFHAKPYDWDPRTMRDDRVPKHDFVIDAMKEDHKRPVPICTNTSYGKRHEFYYDFLSASPDNRSEYTCSRFFRRDTITSLPMRQSHIQPSSQM